jgi:hypothetical protein
VGDEIDEQLLTSLPLRTKAGQQVNYPDSRTRFIGEAA